MTKSCATLDLSAFEATRTAVSADPTVGQGSFTTVTTWEDGARARTTARSFTIETDEPTPLGGTDQGVDPMELVLAALGTCLTIGWVTQAAKRGVEFRDLRIDVSGDYDLRGYLALGGGIDVTRHRQHPRRHQRGSADQPGWLTDEQGQVIGGAAGRSRSVCTNWLK